MPRSGGAPAGTGCGERTAMRVNRALLVRWLSGRHMNRLLKTDLFDEAVGGGLIRTLRRHSCEIVGIDISSRTVSAAGVGGSAVPALACDVPRPSIAAKSFDAAVSNSTLDHFETRDELITSLSELHRVITPGGRLIITMDNRANPLVALRNRLLSGCSENSTSSIITWGSPAGRGPCAASSARRASRFLKRRRLCTAPRVAAVWIAKWLQKTRLTNVPATIPSMAPCVWSDWPSGPRAM